MPDKAENPAGAAPTAQQRSEAIAASQAEAERKQLDETVPGGRYLVNGQLVDSEGNLIEDK